MNSAWPLNAAFFERAVAVVVDSVEVAAAVNKRIKCNAWSRGVMMLRVI
jgi:hypothetical protein